MSAVPFDEVRMTRTLRLPLPVTLPFVLVLSTTCAGPQPPVASPPTEESFAGLSARLSEPGGYFPSDNLVSNETSYLHVLGKLGKLGISGGAYVGVGPDQNFSYIAELRPEVVFIIDIRRDNLLHHLLFKALFENAHSRVEYLSLLTGRAPPEGGDWEAAGIDELVEYIDRTPADADHFEAAVRKVRASVERFGFDLSDQDFFTIRDIHAQFHHRALDIRYSYAPRYPTYRQLLLETDLDGGQRNYLAAEESFRFLKDLQRRNRIIPVVGDLAGPHALRSIGQEIAARNLVIRAFYVSNVEQYLMRDSGFRNFSATVAELPHDDHSVIIRSFFMRGYGHPQYVPGHFSTQLLELFDSFVTEYHNGGYVSYFDLVSKNVLPLKG
jgi:hypothetical protein